MNDNPNKEPTDLTPADEPTTQPVETPEERELRMVENNEVTRGTSDDPATPQVNHLENKLAKEKTKRRSKPAIVALLLLLVAILGGTAALAVYKLYFEKPTQQQATVVEQPKAVEPSALRASDVIAKIKTDLKYTDNSESSISVPIKVAGFDYYTALGQTDQAVGLQSDVAYNQSAVDTAAIAKILQDYGFTEKVIQAGDDESMAIKHYTHKDVICETTVTKTLNNPTGNHQVAVNCANMSDYATVAKAQKALYDVYPHASNPTEGTLLLAGKPTEKTSKTEGYTTAQVALSGVTEDGQAGMGGAAGLFYKTPDGKWHFFTGTQAALACSDYNTDDLKKAYLGEPCFDANGKDSTVAL